MSGWDIGLYYWLKNMSLLEAGVIGGIISGLIIFLCQWHFGRIIHEAKKDTEEGKRLHAVAQGDWPEHIRRAAKNKLRNKNVKIIRKAVLSFLLFIGIVLLPIYLMYSGWSEMHDEEIRKGRLEHIEHIDTLKSLLRLRTLIDIKFPTSSWT